MPLPPSPSKLGSKLKKLPDELDIETLPKKFKKPRKTTAKKVSVVASTAPTVESQPTMSDFAVMDSVPTKPSESKKVVGETLPEAVKDLEKAPVKHRVKRAVQRESGKTKLYVLDTNVLLHDPTSLYRFEEHDVYLPMITLEELDNHKSGMTDVARNARQVSRSLDALMGHLKGSIAEGVSLNATGHRDATGKLFVQTTPFPTKLAMLPDGKADNQILAVTQGLKEAYPDRCVILVSKDINMRLKAVALNLLAEDYFNDKMIEDTDILYTGSMPLPNDFWDEHGKGLKSWQKDGQTYYSFTGPLASRMLTNEFIWLDNGGVPFYGQVQSVESDTAVVRIIKDYQDPKNAVWGITARNREQAFALSLLMDPEIDFVTLLGQAGTGKTLLALAAGLTQTLDQRRFSEIIVTRATISVGEDIGFLPGTEEEKMTPWLGAIDDNLEVLNKGDGSASDWGRKASSDLIRSRIRIKSMSFMRGRTFLNKFVIIDEAQNLTPKQMKTLITRAGKGTKIVCLGNIAQIDTPYLTEGSSGLTYVVDRFKGWAHSGHITMQRGERSRLAEFATEVL